MDIRALTKPLSAFAAVCFLLGVLVFADRPVNAVSETEICCPISPARSTRRRLWKLFMAGACQVPSRCLSAHARRLGDARTRRLPCASGTCKRNPVGARCFAYRRGTHLPTEMASCAGPGNAGRVWQSHPARVRDAEGGLLADVMLGKEEASEVAAIQQIKQLGAVERNFYVRRSDSAQTWLARGRLPRNAQIAAWLDPAFPSLPQEQLVEVGTGKGATEEGAGGPLLRRLPDGSWNKPGGAGLKGSSTFGRRRAIRRLPDTASTLYLAYGNGVIITLEMSALPLRFGRARAAVSTAALNAPQDDAGREKARAMADALNQCFDGWALRLPASAAAQLLVTAVDLDG